MAAGGAEEPTDVRDAIEVSDTLGPTRGADFEGGLGTARVLFSPKGSVTGRAENLEGFVLVEGAVLTAGVGVVVSGASCLGCWGASSSLPASETTSSTSSSFWRMSSPQSKTSSSSMLVDVA